MTIFLYVIAGIIWFGALAGMVIGPFVLADTLKPTMTPKRWAVSAVVWIAIVSLIVCIPVWAGVFDEDNAGHCGPGTIYRESSHYNPSTKTTDTDWWCEAR